MIQEGADKKEKSNTAKKIFSVCFLGLMLVYFLASFFAYIRINTREEGAEAIESFAQLYPFTDQDGGVSVDQDSDSIDDKLSDFAEWFTSSTEEYLTEGNPFYATIKSLNNKLPDLFGGELVLNGDNPFVKLDNGYLAGCCDYCPSPEALGNIADFSAWIEGQDIPFVALVQPDKSDDSITVFPEGVPHGYSRMIDEYKSVLDENGIKYIDATKVLLAQNDDLYSWFYRTDHHWNVHAAYRMADETARVLKEDCSISTDAGALDDGNFELEVYPNSFRGSYARRLGRKWIEDMEIYYPAEDSSFHVEIPSSGIDRAGSFENTLINQEVLKSSDNKYAAFLYGDQPLVRIENNKCKNGSRILVIKGSFANSMCPYLADTVRYLDVIDARDFDGSIRSFIEQTQPDAVILCIAVPTAGDEQYLQLK